jgi:hypothetical protein
VTDGHAPAIHDERDAPVAAGELEEARHRGRVLPHVVVLDRDPLGAVFLTGGGRVRSGVLAVDEHGLGHRSLLPSEHYSAPDPAVHGFPSGPGGGRAAVWAICRRLRAGIALARYRAERRRVHLEEYPMTAARRRVVWKILVAALVGIPWIPIAAALYAWIG